MGSLERSNGTREPGESAPPARCVHYAMNRISPFIALLALLLSADASAQRSSRIDSLILAPLLAGPLEAGPLDLLLPAMLRQGYQTRTWVRDSLPLPGGDLDDLDRMDMIYLRAMNESAGDIGGALLASLIATFEHRKIPFTFGLSLPLTLEGKDAFDRRVERLPRRLFADMPNGDDRDKLQHFFGSAWLAWALDNGTLADMIGLGIEVGEEMFISGGANDARDVRANRLAHMFVELLREYPRALPSVMFRAWNRREIERAEKEKEKEKE